MRSRCVVNGGNLKREEEDEKTIGEVLGKGNQQARESEEDEDRTWPTAPSLQFLVSTSCKGD